MTEDPAPPNVELRMKPAEPRMVNQTALRGKEPPCEGTPKQAVIDQLLTGVEGTRDPDLVGRVPWVGGPGRGAARRRRADRRCQRQAPSQADCQPLGHHSSRGAVRGPAHHGAAPAGAVHGGPGGAAAVARGLPPARRPGRAHHRAARARRVHARLRGESRAAAVACAIAVSCPVLGPGCARIWSGRWTGWTWWPYTSTA